MLFGGLVAKGLGRELGLEVFKFTSILNLVLSAIHFVAGLSAETRIVKGFKVEVNGLSGFSICKPNLNHIL